MTAKQLQAITLVTEAGARASVRSMHFRDTGLNLGCYATLLGNTHPDGDFCFLDILLHLENQLRLKTLERIICKKLT